MNLLLALNGISWIFFCLYLQPKHKLQNDILWLHKAVRH